MTEKMDGMTYAPTAKHSKRVVAEGAFVFSVIGLDHGHIFAMTNGLLEAGATLKAVYDDDASKVDEFVSRYPTAQRARSIQEILGDDSLHLVASAIRPKHRAALGIDVMRSGKHFFCDKPGMLTEEEIERVRKAVHAASKRYFIYYGERIHVEGALYVQKLIEEGRLGEIVSMTILAPHRMNKDARPAWFFDPSENGGIIIDIGSHQIEQFLTFTGSASAQILHSSVGNYATGEYPEFHDFGHCALLGENGSTCYFRVDWFTPDGLGAWGDGRLFIVGTKASVEIRKYIDVARSKEGDRVYLVDKHGEHLIEAHGTIGFPFFGAMILDCLDGSENAIGQEHTLEVMRLAIAAQNSATILR